MQVAVIGVGSFGRNHARVFRELANQSLAERELASRNLAAGEQPTDAVELVAIVDANLERAQAVAAEYGARAFASVGEMLAAYPKLAAASENAEAAGRISISSMETARARVTPMP